MFLQLTHKGTGYIPSWPHSTDQFVGVEGHNQGDHPKADIKAEVQKVYTRMSFCFCHNKACYQQNWWLKTYFVSCNLYMQNNACCSLNNVDHRVYAASHAQWISVGQHIGCVSYTLTTITTDTEECVNFQITMKHVVFIQANSWRAH